MTGVNKMDKKQELDLNTVRKYIEREIGHERFEYTGALLLWSVYILVIAILCTVFFSGWLFLALLIPIGAYLYMCVKWYGVLRDLKKGIITVKTDKLRYRKPESEFNFFTFIIRVGGSGRRYRRTKLTQDVNSLYFESGARLSSPFGYSGSNDSNDEMTYYLIYVGDRTSPFAAFNTAEYELSEEEKLM